MGLGDVLGSAGMGGNVQLAAGSGGSLQSAYTEGRAYTTGNLMGEALVDVLADKYPGMNVNVRVFMDVEDQNTLFYTSIYSWSLPDFEHEFMPSDMHLKNMLENPAAGAVVMSQFAHWDMSFAELQGYHKTWSEEHTRSEQAREREAAKQLQKIAQQPRNYPQNPGYDPSRYPNPQDINPHNMNPGPHWRGDNAREQYNGPDRNSEDARMDNMRKLMPKLMGKE